MKRIYIAGPMSGWPDNNYPAFNAKAEELRAEGWAVENPAENPVPECGTWLGYMRMALRQLALCDAIYLLPWHETSRGASIERNLALALGLKVIEPETSRRDGAQQWGAVGDQITKAARDVLAERARQINVEGRTPENDDAYSLGQLAGAAGCYARHVQARNHVVGTKDNDYARSGPSMYWPWHASWWKPSTPRRDLVKAGALILAEIERFDRMEARRG